MQKQQLLFNAIITHFINFFHLFIKDLMGVSSFIIRWNPSVEGEAAGQINWWIKLDGAPLFYLKCDDRHPDWMLELLNRVGTQKGGAFFMLRYFISFILNFMLEDKVSHHFCFLPTLPIKLWFHEYSIAYGYN